LKNFIRRVLSSCILLTALFLSTLAAPLPVNAADTVPGNAVMSISPASVKAEAGETFTLNIILDSDTFLRAASCTINYDTKYLECTSVTEGGIFSDWAAANESETYVTPKPNLTKTPGEISTGVAIIGGTEENALDGPSTGTFLVCEFKAKSSVNGNSNVTLSDVEIFTSVSDGKTRSIMLDGITSEYCQVTVGTVSSTTAPPASPSTTTPATTTTPPTSNTSTASIPTTTSSTPQTTVHTTAPVSTTASQVSSPTTAETIGTGGQTIPWAIVGGTIGLVLLVGAGGFIILNKKK
jgi:hypothetical protein